MYLNNICTLLTKLIVWFNVMPTCLNIPAVWLSGRAGWQLQLQSRCQVRADRLSGRRLWPQTQTSCYCGRRCYVRNAPLWTPLCWTFHPHHHHPHHLRHHPQILQDCPHRVESVAELVSSYTPVLLKHHRPPSWNIPCSRDQLRRRPLNLKRGCFPTRASSHNRHRHLPVTLWWSCIEAHGQRKE